MVNKLKAICKFMNCLNSDKCEKITEKSFEKQVKICKNMLQKNGVFGWRLEECLKK